MGCAQEQQSEGPAAHSRAYLEAFLVERDWPQWPRYFAADATLNGSVLALQIMRGTADGLHFAFSDLALEVLNQVAEGDQVATRFVLRARHDGPFEGMAPTDRTVALQGYAFDRFDAQGRVVEAHMLLDLIGLSRQLGTQAAQP